MGTKILGLTIGLLICLAVAGGLSCLNLNSPEETTEGEPQAEALMLSDFPDVFANDTIIVIGNNASQIEEESAEAIASQFANLTGNLSIIKNDTAIVGDDKIGHNLILVGTPNANCLLQEVYNLTNATRVTEEYPGAYKGILEILRNPWGEEKAMLLVEGSDVWGVKIGELVLSDSKKLEKKAKLFVDWVKYTGVEFPIDSSEEAIRYAKTDPDVKEFIREWLAEGYKIGTWAEWDPLYNVWEVGISPDNDIRDILFLLHIKPDGAILEKGIVPTA